MKRREYLAPSDGLLLDDFAAIIHEIIFALLMERVQQFLKCKSLVTYPLSSRMFGLWDSGALQVVERADLIRRREGHRFISVDHLLSGMPTAEVTKMSHLHNCIFRLSMCPKYAIAEKREESSSKDGGKTEYTIYHVYQKANEIAESLDHREIGLVHLFLAIMSPSHYEALWGDFFRKYLQVETKKNRAEDEANTICAIDVWDEFIDNDGTRSISGSFLREVEKIQEVGFYSPLKFAISNISEGDQYGHSPMKKCQH